jgi:hypothetical protein
MLSSFTKTESKLSCAMIRRCVAIRSTESSIQLRFATGQRTMLHCSSPLWASQWKINPSPTASPFCSFVTCLSATRTPTQPGPPHAAHVTGSDRFDQPNPTAHDYRSVDRDPHTFSLLTSLIRDEHGTRLFFLSFLTLKKKKTWVFSFPTIFYWINIIIPKFLSP